MSLTAEHLSDLRASGLTQATIEACGYEAVRPHEIKLHGVTSAYRLKYHDLDGKPNCAERWKLFPAITGPDGIQKYHQTPGTAPALYMPPLFAWKAVAREARLPIVITEGEKKAAAGCQVGLHALGVAGVWNWRQRLDTGERLLLPTFDQFVWKERDVLVVPDSDAWRAEKQLKVLSGFYALAQQLVSRGASVRLLKLPERLGVKIGLDDWLISVGTGWESLWPQLERINLDAPQLAPIAAWWQAWREKQASLGAIKTKDSEALDLNEAAGLYTVRATKYGVVFTFDRLEDQRGAYHAELTVSVGDNTLLDAVDVNLRSDTAHNRHAKSLTPYSDSIPWKVLLQKACALVLRRHRQGAPPLHLNRSTYVEPLTFAINPLVPRRKPGILYADGGKGKSTFALMLSMLVSTGKSLAGFSALPGRPLYLDYEDDHDVHTRRLHAIMAGHPELSEADVLYQRCTEPLWKLTRDLVRLVQSAGVTFVVLDSLMAATGGDASAEATGKLFAALRVLNVESLCIGHVPKTIAEGHEHATVYGSIFNQNFSRAVWELRTEQQLGEDKAILGLFHRKANLTRKHPPIGIEVTQNEDSSYVHYVQFDLSQTSELEKGLPLPNRIRNLLDTDGVPRSSQQIAEALGEKLTVVQTTLSRHKGKKWSMIGENRDSSWTTLKHP